MKNHVMRDSLITVCLAALAIAGCGGSGAMSDANSTQFSSTVTSGNASDIAANAYAAAVVLNSEAGSGSGLLSASSTGQINCPVTGTIRYVTTEAESGKISSGDSTETIASNCSDGSFHLDGSYKVEFITVTGSPSGEDEWSAILGVTYTNYTRSTGLDSVRDDGAMVIGMHQHQGSHVSHTVNGSSYSIAKRIGNTSTSLTLIDFTYTGSLVDAVSSYSADFILMGRLKHLANANYSVKTSTPFKQVEGSFPYEGAMTVTATDKSSMRLNVISSTEVQIQLDKNADGLYEEMFNTSWDDLAGRF